MSRHWNAEAILELARHYQPACVLAAAADLDLFRHLTPRPLTAAAAARRLRGDLRATTILLDALAALRLLDKRGQRYAVPPTVGALLSHHERGSVLAMVQHQANCLRRWSQLARSIRTGQPVPKPFAASIRGAAGDQASFIGAMHNVSAPAADRLIRFLRPLKFRHLLDVGGASGTWTIAFLRSCPTATATLFDLPPVIPLARRRLADAGLRARVKLVAGDFLRDPLPAGADLAWVSAIVHQNSRRQNRALFARVFAALVPGGRIVLRDILMGPTRTTPVAGALFAVNMLTATESGGTFTCAELQEDLRAAGFTTAAIAHQDEGMNSLVVARKPA